MQLAGITRNTALVAAVRRILGAGWRFVSPSRRGRMLYLRLVDRMPVKQNVILIDSYQGRMPYGNMFYVLRELAENERYHGFEIYYSAWWLKVGEFRRLLRAYGLEDRIDLIVRGGRRYARALAQAGYVITDWAPVTWFCKRDGQALWNMWHGVGLKAAGRYSAGGGPGSYQSSFAKADYLSCPSMHCLNYLVDCAMSRSLARNARLLWAGYPRNDAFFDRKAAAQMRARLGDPRRLYAYFPTWRRAEATSSRKKRATTLREHLGDIDRLLDDGETLVVKLHPLDTARPDFSAYRRIVGIPADVEIYQVLSACDVLITDYSSVMSDFALTGRKIVVYAYDEEQYAETRGWYLPPESVPFPKAHDVASLVNELRTPKDYDDAKYLEPLYKHNAPDVTRRLVAQIIFGERHFPEEVLAQTGRANLLVCPGKTARSGGKERLVEQAVMFAGASGAVPYLCLMQRFIAEHREMMCSLPETVSWVACHDGETPLLFMAALSLLHGMPGRWRALLSKRLDRFYRLEAQRLFNGDRWFSEAICDVDADAFFIMTIARLPCKKALYAAKESLENCNGNVLRHASGHYDEAIVEDMDAAHALRQIIGDALPIRSLAG